MGKAHKNSLAGSSRAPENKPNRARRKEQSEGDPVSALIAPALGAWYARHHRVLPWRAPFGRCGDPYHVWLSEIMLQQTTVAAVKSYYEKFLRLWPTLDRLAAAPVEDVLREWAGLGYYSRARNLHACARAVMSAHQGKFPKEIKELQVLPGIGPYTAAAIGAMAFGAGVVPVDGNIERVVTRLYRLDRPVVEIKPDIRARAQALYDCAATPVFAGDLAQGLMDLGATVCTPKSPRCPACPLRDMCAAYAARMPERFPVPAPKKEKPTRVGDVFLISDGRGRFLLERRPDRGLLAGMVGLPTSEWQENPLNSDTSAPKSPIPIKKSRQVGEVRHSFTHFNLILRVIQGEIGARARDLPDQFWYEQDRLKQAGLPQVFVKALAFIIKAE